MTATQPSVSTEKVGVAPLDTLASGEGSKAMLVPVKWRSEVDTSAPFESVKEAVDRFGGSAVWKSQLKQLFHPGKHHSVEESELLNVQEQTARMEKDLIAKQHEILEILKELEVTRRTVDSLKSRLHEESSEVDKFPETLSDNVKLHSAVDHKGEITRVDSLHAGNLAGIRASIESFNVKVVEEKALLKKTLEKLLWKRADVSSLEEELRNISLRLQLTKEAKDICKEDPAGSSKEISHLPFEREPFSDEIEAAKSEVLRLTPAIERTKAAIKATEIRWLAVKKMEEESKAAEAAALAQSKALINSLSSTTSLQNNSAVVLSVEEYAKLIQKVKEADESSRSKIEAALLEVERANHSKLELIAKIEEAAEDLEIRRKALDQALSRVETANTGKQAVQEALRRWRSEHGHRGRHVYKSTKFKNSYPGHHPHTREFGKLDDCDELNLVADDPRNGSKHTLSIGEILSRKLIGPDDYNIGISDRSNDKATVSLGQIISRRSAVLSKNGGGSVLKQHPRMRKKFVFVGLSNVSINHNMKSKNIKRKQISGRM